MLRGVIRYRPLRRFLRILITTLAALSLILFLAAAVLWPRSHLGAGDEYTFDQLRGTDTDRFLSCVSRNGKLSIRYARATHVYRQMPLRTNWHKPGLMFWRASDGRASDWQLIIDYWLVLALTSPFPAIVLLRYASRRRARSRKGLCPFCGYDLRATPERCPECGTDVSALTPAKPPRYTPHP